jgi:hypothetical protein
MNKRIFIMLEGKFIGYLSSPTYDFPLTYQYITKNAKMTVPLTEIKRLDFREKGMLHIDFWVTEDGRKIEKSWVLKMDN